MECCGSFELSSVTLRQFVKNLGKVKKALNDKEKRKLFFNRFPYEQLFNFTLIDNSNVALCVKILNLFICYEEFTNYEDRFNFALEYVLLNLSYATSERNEIFRLLQLLSKLLSRNCYSVNFSFNYVFDRERILELMVKLSNFRSVQKSKFIFYSSILNCLVNVNFSDSLNDNISGLFERFNENNVLTEQIVTCKLILNSGSKIFCDSFQNVWKWLVSKCPDLIKQNLDCNLLEDAIHCLTTFISNWVNLRIGDTNEIERMWEYIKELLNNLLNVVSDICLHTTNFRLRPGCLKLLSFILRQFLEQGELCPTPEDQVLQELNRFPENVHLWPKSDRDLFFCISHICLANDKLIWKAEDVLHAIIRCFYNKRPFINRFVLKSIFYLYPKLTDTADVDLTVKILGDDLLYYFEKVCSASYLYTYDAHQLKWILENSPESMKLTVLTHWLNTLDLNESLEDTLTQTITDCKAEMTLLHLMLNSNNFGRKIGLRSAMILRQTENSEVSSTIGLILPFTIERPPAFYNLLIAEPNIIFDSGNSYLICSLMSALIPTLEDAEILRGACVFTCKILKINRNNPSIIKGFCRNITNIQQIISISSKVDDDTSVVIISLLKILIIIQQRNKVKLEWSLREDFKVFMKGSLKKIEKSLSLLRQSMVSRYSLIILQGNNTLELYHLLMDYTLNPNFQEIAFQCLIILIKRFPWLAQIISTVVYIETVCLSFPDETFKVNVLKMLDVWLNIIYKEHDTRFSPIPQTTLRSFIMRNCKNKAKLERYLSILDILMKEEEEERPRTNIFSINI